MSLLDKSQQNKNAFLLLKEHNKGFEDEKSKFTSSAVHCCYYSCFQKATYILKVYFEQEYEKINQREGGTHNKQISVFTRQMVNLFSEKINIALVRRALTELRELRHRADYSDGLITETELARAEQHLFNFHSTLKKELSI
jgi:hypothetical protein